MSILYQGQPHDTGHSHHGTLHPTWWLHTYQGLSIQDRQVLLTHTASETTKIYTHPNFELAAEFINRLPEVFIMANPSATKRV